MRRNGGARRDGRHLQAAPQAECRGDHRQRRKHAGWRRLPPGDIVTVYGGKHIEIINTDAEGRVVLADAISYARKDRKAAAIIDLATLTGACCVALGEHAAGLWSNDEALGSAVLK